LVQFNINFQPGAQHLKTSV